MKKLLKAVALITVLCMALSMSAFAAENGDTTVDEDAKTITVNVLGAGANEEVALLIVKTGVELANASEGQIMYIDQAVANADGAVAFNNVKILDENEKIDVYVGSADLDEAKCLGTDISVKGVGVITLVDDSAIVVDAVGDGGVYAGYGVALTVNVPEGLEISKMIWAFDVKLKGEDKATRKFSKAIGEDCDTPLPAIVADASGNVQFAATFPAGLVGDVVSVDNVGAIFLTSDKAEHFTNESDKELEKKDN